VSPAVTDLNEVRLRSLSNALSTMRRWAAWQVAGSDPRGRVSRDPEIVAHWGLAFGRVDRLLVHVLRAAQEPGDALSRYRQMIERLEDVVADCERRGSPPRPRTRAAASEAWAFRTAASELQRTLRDAHRAPHGFSRRAPT